MAVRVSDDGKTFDEKKGWDWRLHADSVQEEIRRKRETCSFGSLRTAGLSCTSPWEYISFYGDYDIKHTHYR
jgi:hypothetical protein